MVYTRVSVSENKEGKKRADRLGCPVREKEAIVPSLGDGLKITGKVQGEEAEGERDDTYKHHIPKGGRKRDRPAKAAGRPCEEPLKKILRTELKYSESAGGGVPFWSLKKPKWW